MSAIAKQIKSESVQAVKVNWRLLLVAGASFISALLLTVLFEYLGLNLFAA